MMETNGKIQLFPFLRVALMLILGIIIGDSWFREVPPIYFLFALVFLLIIFHFIKYKPIIETTIILFSFFVFGIWIILLHEDDLQIRLPNTDVEYEAVLASQPVEKGKTIKFDMIVTRCHGLKLSHPIRVKASILRDTLDCQYKKLNVGDGIIAYSLLEAPQNYFTDSNFDYRRWLKVHGFVAQTFIYYDNWQRAVVSLSSLSRLERTKLVALRFRQKLLQRFKRLGMEGQPNAVVSAMTLGDKSQMNNKIKNSYSIAGASHVLALSGLHLGIIYTIFLFLFPRYRWRILSQSISLICIWSYVILVGMSPSVVRSATMITIYAFTLLLNRKKMSINALSFAATIMLVCNPLNLWDVGFQMSYMAVLSIFVFYKPLYRLIPDKILKSSKVLNWIWGMTVLSFSAQIGTFPLVMYYFGRFSCYSILANYIVVPSAIIILNSTFIMFMFSPFFIIQKYIAIFVSFITQFLNKTITFIASLPGASIENIKINEIQVIAIYINIIVIYLFCFYLKKMYKISRI